MTGTSAVRLAVEMSCGVTLVLSLLPPATPDAPWPVQFHDVADRAGLRVPSVYGGVDRKRFIIETNGAGVAWIDLDDDGWVDAIVLGGTRLASGARHDDPEIARAGSTTRVYHNRRDGTFADITDRSGLGRTAWASSICAGDYDNDGAVDLFVTSFGTNVLYRNRGGLRFDDRSAAAGLPVTGARWGSGCSFLDYDRDGDLDLFVANYLAFDLATAQEPGQGVNCLWKGIPVNCGPKGLPTDTNLLYRNGGDGRFADVSDLSGIARVRNRFPMSVVAADLDEDGWVDLYVASDSTAAIHYRNNQDGTFSDVAVARGTAFSENGMSQAGMGAAAGDIDADGRLDLVKTHFADDIPALFRALGNGRFEEVAMAAGLGSQNRYVEWGTGLVDFDNDGWQDLLYVTGNVYPEVERQMPDYPYKGPRIVFRNRGRGSFDDVSATSGPGATTPQSSRGAAFGDFDNDGDVDVLVMNMNEPPSLLRNDVTAGNSWLQVRLEGTTSNRAGLGATVRVTAAGRTQARAALSQSSYYSHDDLRLPFGLGKSARVERVEIQWPSGRREVVADVGANQIVTVREGQGVVGQRRKGGR
jgi:enediyne biosynthesis protein E4